MRKLHSKYAAAFDFLEKKEAINLEKHLGQLKNLEKYLPNGLTFMFITNASTQQYLFFTDNVKNCTGYSVDELCSGGVPFVLGRVHKEDREMWTKAVSMLTGSLVKLEPDKMLKCNLQFNYRFQHKNGNYINVVDNFIPIELNEKGLPFLFFGQVNIVGAGEKLPVSASMSLLDPSGGYTTLYKVNVNEKLISDHFTKREKNIFEYMLKGYSNKSIAQELLISIETVKTHRKNINAKLKQMELTKKDLVYL